MTKKPRFHHKSGQVYALHVIYIAGELHSFRNDDVSMRRSRTRTWALIIALLITLWYTTSPPKRLDMSLQERTRPWANEPIPLVKTPVAETGKVISIPYIPRSHTLERH